jgi:hypothetical protein
MRDSRGVLHDLDSGIENGGAGIVGDRSEQGGADRLTSGLGGKQGCQTEEDRAQEPGSVLRQFQPQKSFSLHLLVSKSKKSYSFGVVHPSLFPTEKQILPCGLTCQAFLHVGRAGSGRQKE